MAAAGHIRLGTASPSPPSSTSATIALIDTLAQRAASSKIDILLLPEAFIGGYPRGSSFGCAIGDRSAAGREEFARYFDNAIDLGDTVGPAGGGAGVKWVKRQLGEEDEVRGDGSREELERIARDTGVFVVVGCIEKAGGSLYCSVVYVCPKEGTLGKRRKVLPTGTERLIWSQGSPSTLRAVTTTIRGIRINLAAAICWESYMPLLRQSLYSQNINLYLAPTADFRDAWLSVMRTVGVEGRCFVVSSNMCIPKGSPAETTETNGTGNGNVPAAREPRERRGSCFTEEGFEIALPKSPSQSRRRRKSVFDEDGNEIVLGCEDDGEAPAPAKRPQLASLKESNKTEFNRADYVSTGGSSIVSPFGDVIAGPQWGDPDGLIYADVDFRDCIRGRLDLDTAGSYSRNDSFKFGVEGLNLDPLPY